MTRLVRTDVTDGVMTVTLDDAANRNALSQELTAELVEAMDRADRDATVRVVVLTNAGTVFCAGADLRQRSAPAPAGKRAGSHELFARFRRSPKPYVGRIAGHCMAGGLGIAAALDITIAADDVKFGFTEVRLGVVPAMISVVCLPKMRAADARAAMLRGNRFGADEAARMGLINQSVPRAQLDAAVQAVVDDLLAGGPAAIAATKQVLEQVPGMAFDEAVQWTGALSARMFASDEGREGMAAYLGKRPAAWIPARRAGPPDNPKD